MKRIEHRILFQVLLTLFSFCLFVKSNPQEYVLISPDESAGIQPFQIQTTRLQIKHQNAFLAIIQGALSPAATTNSSRTQKHFRILVQDSKCSLQKTSNFAKQSDCLYAVNGGPFRSYIRGGCVGATVSNGTVIQNGNQQMDDESGNSHIDPGFEDNNIKRGNIPFLDRNVAFGVTKDNHWIVGNLEKYNLSNLQELVTGLDGWLVYNSSVVPESIDHNHQVFESGHNQKQAQRSLADINFENAAPRTAIGVDKSGVSLVLLQVDGCEHCTSPLKRNAKGLTMHEMAVAMKTYADYAINLDGGGSSTSVYRGNVLNRPTCLDYLNVRCERPVASVVCIIGQEDN